MRIVKVTRYYCEYCGRGHFHRKKAETHETNCTLNPHRKCGLCKLTGETPLDPLAYLDANPPPDIMADTKKIREYQDRLAQRAECPACMLAVIRQSGLVFPDFDFKKELEDFWSNFNDAAKDSENYY